MKFYYIKITIYIKYIKVESISARTKKVHARLQLLKEMSDTNEVAIKPHAVSLVKNNQESGREK